MSWSPDGSRLAFTSTRDTRDDDNPELYVMNADGSSIKRLTHSPGIEGVPVLVARRTQDRVRARPLDPRWAFFVMNADGTGVQQVNWSLPGKKH